MSAANVEAMHGPLTRTPEEWAKIVTTLGGRSFHGRQVFRWIMVKNEMRPEAMSDLPQALREKLAADGLGPVLSVKDARTATDRTKKLLVEMKDGAVVETVLIPGVTGKRRIAPDTQREPEIHAADASVADEDDVDEDESVADRVAGREPKMRVTQCISTQVGCAMGCVFCASGVAGLKRHMSADEIVAQVLLGRAHLAEDERLSNVVYMGMGEPLANYDAVAHSLRMLTHRDGISLSNRRVTVSTSGLVPEIERLGKDFGGHIGLAISLHAADDETRTRLMPINKKYPLTMLMQALRAYPLPPRRRITIEYTLVRGKNDHVDEAKRLARLLSGLPVKVNLIPMNPIELSTLGPPDDRGVLAFQDVLVDAGYSCFIRRRRGDDVAAACGQLALHGAKPKVRVNRDA